jgi:hypothetical protein
MSSELTRGLGGSDQTGGDGGSAGVEQNYREHLIGGVGGGGEGSASSSSH